MTATTVSPGATASTIETFVPGTSWRSPRPRRGWPRHTPGSYVIVGYYSTAANVQHAEEMFLGVLPARTLAGVVSQLESGYRFAFTPELRQLAQRAVARRQKGPEPVDEWAKRLAREAAELAD